MTDDDPIQPALPELNLDTWRTEGRSGNALAVHPAGKTCYLAWSGGLYAFRTSDGKARPVLDRVFADQVVLSPDGGRLVAASPNRGGGRLTAVTIADSLRTVVWRKKVPPPANVAGFLPDGDRFVTLDSAVRIRSFDSGAELYIGRLEPSGVRQPQITLDGRFLGAIGDGRLYFHNLVTLDQPRAIIETRYSGDIRSFAFHPNGRTVAVIHGRPTGVKVYDLQTLTLVHEWNWNLGPLRSVAYSPDGTVAAAGSGDGRIVVWDVDE